MRGRKDWIRPFAVRALALALAGAVALICVEVTVRLAGWDRPLVWQPDPQVGWRHIPGATMHWREEGDGVVHIDSLGLRDPERTLVKPAGVFRIAVFGDSMTEGVPGEPGSDVHPTS